MTHLQVTASEAWMIFCQLLHVDLVDSFCSYRSLLYNPSSFRITILEPTFVASIDKGLMYVFSASGDHADVNTIPHCMLPDCCSLVSWSRVHDQKNSLTELLSEYRSFSCQSSLPWWKNWLYYSLCFQQLIPLPLIPCRSSSSAHAALFLLPTTHGFTILANSLCPLCKLVHQGEFPS
jgi:hypothetical protein